MSIIEELYNGNIDPSEKYMRDDSTYRKTHNELVHQMDALSATLTDVQKELLEKIEDTEAELRYLSEKSRFIEGFCLGAQLQGEILQWENSPYI